MIQPEILSRLRLLADAYRLPVTLATDRVNQATAVPGVSDVLAEVEARLSDGLYRVLAAGQRFSVNLPPTTAPGDRVRITLPAAPAPAAAAAAKTPATATPASAVEPRVSAIGRFISALAERAPEGRTPAAISTAQPLLPDAPIDTKVAAATLRELIGLSGLFYESHQAEWVGGAREEAQLRKEPQGKFSAALPATAATSSNSSSASASSTASSASASSIPATPAPPTVRAEALPIVQQQIQTLEARHIVWAGQVWPGQPLRWEIEELKQREPQAAAQAPGAWQTRIDMSTPRLGAMSALLTLSGGALSVRLRAESEATDTEFSAHLDELRLALESAGVPVAAIARDSHAAT